MKRGVLALAVFLVAGCGGGSSSPTEPSCANIAGSWNGSYTNSCGGHVTGSAGITQTGCSFTIVGLPGTTFTGNLSGNNGSFSVTGTTPCASTATGTLSVSGNTISGSYTGTITTFSSQCCPVGAYSGGFTLTR